MTDNPYLRRRGGIGRTGRKAENRAAGRLKARQTLASGALGQKGDYDAGSFLVENKATTAGSMALQYEWLVKIAREAVMAGKDPALAVQFTRSDGRPVDDGAWVMIPETVFRRIMEGDTE